MPAPLNPNLWPSVLHDEDGIPISASNPLPVSVGGGGGGNINVVILGLTQVPTVETTTPLNPDETFDGASHDCLNYESFGISVYLEPTAGQTVASTVTVENSDDGATWRPVDTFSLNGAAADDPAFVNRVYSVTRRHYRVTVHNEDVTNPLTVTEIDTMLKPI